MKKSTTKTHYSYGLIGVDRMTVCLRPSTSVKTTIYLHEVTCRLCNNKLVQVALRDIEEIKKDIVKLRAAYK